MIVLRSVVVLGLAWVLALPAWSFEIGRDTHGAPIVDYREFWTGNLPAMIERRLLRVAVSYSRTHFFLDGGRNRGLTHDLVKAFGDHLNEQLGLDETQSVRIVIVPVPRSELLSSVMNGEADLAAGDLAITEQRTRLVDFSVPLRDGIEEVIVTSTLAPRIGSLADLSERRLHLHRSSGAWQRLETVNEYLGQIDRPGIILEDVSETLEHEDLLELASSGVLQAVVVPLHKARLWAKILPGLTVHDDIALRTDIETGWAMRKESPKLKAALDGFVHEARKGTALGNILARRYLETNRWARLPLTGSERKRFERVEPHLRKAAVKHGFDWTLLAALAYQESRFDQTAVSEAGARGVMQILPSTAASAWLDGLDIGTLEENVEAGARYLRHLLDRYENDPALSARERILLALASYNAGPARIDELRQQAHAMGFDPNRWFGHVEVVAGERIGGETVRYVASIARRHFVYHAMSERLEERRKELAALVFEAVLRF